MRADEGLVGKMKGFSQRGEDKRSRLQMYIIKSTLYTWMRFSKIITLLKSSAMKINTVTAGHGGAHL